MHFRLVACAKCVGARRIRPRIWTTGHVTDAVSHAHFFKPTVVPTTVLDHRPALLTTLLAMQDHAVI